MLGGASVVGVMSHVQGLRRVEATCGAVSSRIHSGTGRAVGDLRHPRDEMVLNLD